MIFFVVPMLVATSPATHANEKVATRPVVENVCDLIESAALRNKLPVSYFARLIWQESRFKANARSPVGALGVAQFMPDTASERGLKDPLSRPEALSESAAYLSELRRTFGNLGLAAAAYNAGPARLSRWLAKQTDLPQETLDYIEIVTGHPISAWIEPKVPDLGEEPGFSCRRMAELARAQPSLEAGGTAKARAWAVILVANPQRDKVLAEYAIVRSTYSKLLGGAKPSVVRRRIGGLPEPKYIVQIERDTREAASSFCKKLASAGGACFVLANR